MWGAPDWALDEEMVTMRPQPSASMSGTASCMQTKVPVRLTASMWSHFSGVMSATASNDSMPALVTRMVIGPNWALTAANTFSSAPRSATSTWWAAAAGPSFAQRGRRRLRPRTVAVEQGDGMAGFGQPMGDTQPDARCRPGDHRHPGAHCGASVGVNSIWRSWSPRSTQVGS